MTNKSDSFSNRRGFIIASIGSAVGLAVSLLIKAVVSQWMDIVSTYG